MEAKISIIIPVYNVEPYICKCLDSVIGQTYKNLQIICVDDGSTDNSGKICDEYATRDRRMTVIHKKNGGVSSARNVGLERAYGDYIGFVDPDDWIDVDFYRYLLEEIIKNNADIAISGIIRETEEKSTVQRNAQEIPTRNMSGYEFLEYVFKRDEYRGVGAYVWNKLFSRNLLLDYEIVRFDETIKVCEDIVFFTDVVMRCHSVVYVNIPLYHYCQRCGSLFWSDRIKEKEDVLKAYDMVLQLLNEYGDEINVWVKRFYCYHASLLAELAYKLEDWVKLREFQNCIKRFLSEYISTNWEYPDRLKRMEEILSFHPPILLKKDLRGVDTK